MAKLEVFDINAKKIEDIEVNDSVFGIEVNNQAIFDAVLRQQASLRQGTHDTKTRREVSGGGKKPFKQKGTGRARQGSTRATQHRGGGIAFGPTPRKYIFKLNRKVRKLALRSALSQKVLDSNILVLNELNFGEIKTKTAKAMLDAFKIERKVLFVVDVEEDFDNAYLSLRNIENVNMITVEGVNVYDLVNTNKLVFTKTAIKKVEEALINE
ncbi:MAG: 50S ribosomal protein L4 [Erysipelotrichaceae bacterium]|nr:50S ribosomal protein L4 [Erysipelotrichaceae bacterium]